MGVVRRRNCPRDFAAFLGVRDTTVVQGDDQGGTRQVIFQDLTPFCLLCVVLMVVQYWCARTGAWMMFRLGGAGDA